MEIEGIKIDDTVDITDKVCPLTFVKAKVAIDELDDGEVIAIRMNDGEPVANVPEVLKMRDIKSLNLLIIMMRHIHSLLKKLKNKEKIYG